MSKKRTLTERTGAERAGAQRPFAKRTGAPTRLYTVSELAALAHVTVRTLHHYDEIGVLAPSARSDAGYRLYGADDLTRLQQILLLRALGFSLEAIAGMIDQPALEQRTALAGQRRLLEKEMKRLRTMLRGIDTALAAGSGKTMSTDEMFEGLGETEAATVQSHAAEAEQRWGESRAYKESARRTKSYKNEDWARIKAEAEFIVNDAADKMAAGRRPADPEVADIAERHRLHIDRWFYPCSHAMHLHLGAMYVADERFTAYYDRHRPGLAQFFSDAIQANAARAGVVAVDEVFDTASESETVEPENAGKRSAD